MLFMLLLALGIDQNIVNKDNYEFVQISCLLFDVSSVLLDGNMCQKDVTSLQHILLGFGDDDDRAVVPEVAWSPALKANDGIVAGIFYVLGPGGKLLAVSACWCTGQYIDEVTLGHRGLAPHTVSCHVPG
ncbi:hypothetical protein Tco_0500187 [Tanacetum coccineum]